MRNKLTKHHIVAKGEGGSNHEYNLVKLPRNLHRALHTLFGNMEPLEQIQFLLNINSNALQGDVKQDIENIIELYKDKVYHIGVIKK